MMAVVSITCGTANVSDGVTIGVMDKFAGDTLPDGIAIFVRHTSGGLFRG